MPLRVLWPVDRMPRHYSIQIILRHKSIDRMAAIR